MGFFCDVPVTEIRAITKTEGNELDHTLTALRLSNKANAVSRCHLDTLRRMWQEQHDICDIISITNAQNYTFWHNDQMYGACKANDNKALTACKAMAKLRLFEEVADQCGEIYNEKICTIVFAKRFASYKRPDLFFQDMDRFHKLLTNTDRPVQMIWAGKPYPMDYAGIGIFDKIADICKTYSNCSILAGYELKLSKLLKQGSDVWLNVPRLTHEASGTSGMTAAMNGSVNVALPDGWFPEFAKDKINSFVIPSCDFNLPEHMQDDADADSLFKLLEDEILPLYYDYPERWLEIVKNGMTDIIPHFDSNRMAQEYYEKLYIAD
jgi:starch phosphorylase